MKIKLFLVVIMCLTLSACFVRGDYSKGEAYMHGKRTSHCTMCSSIDECYLGSDNYGKIKHPPPDLYHICKYKHRL